VPAKASPKMVVNHLEVHIQAASMMGNTLDYSFMASLFSIHCLDYTYWAASLFGIGHYRFLRLMIYIPTKQYNLYYTDFYLHAQIEGVDFLRLNIYLACS
jgi:hypothetical protein